MLSHSRNLKGKYELVSTLVCITEATINITSFLPFLFWQSKIMHPRPRSALSFSSRHHPKSRECKNEVRRIFVEFSRRSCGIGTHPSSFLAFQNLAARDEDSLKVGCTFNIYHYPKEMIAFKHYFRSMFKRL